MLKFSQLALNRGILGGEKNGSSLNFNKRIGFSLPKMLGFWVGVSVFAISFATTASATTYSVGDSFQSCASMGYKSTLDNCDGRSRIRCPWNANAYFCGRSDNSNISGDSVACNDRAGQTNAQYCNYLGYKYTAAQCSGYVALPCPFDSSKVYCQGMNTCAEDGYVKNATCPSGQTATNTKNCPADSSYKKLTCQGCGASFTLSEEQCKEKWSNCEQCSLISSLWKGSGTQYSTKTCAKGDILFSNKKCYTNDTAPSYQSKIAVVYALASDSLGINSAMALTETSTTVSPSGSCSSITHYRYSGGWGSTKSDIFNDKTYTVSGSSVVYHNNNTAEIRSKNSACIYSCSNGGFVPTVRDWYYYKNNSQAATKFTSNGGTAPNMSTNYWVSNRGPYWYGTGQYDYVDGGRYVVQPSSISASSPFAYACAGSGAYGCGSGCPSNSNARCAKVRCVYTF